MEKSEASLNYKRIAKAIEYLITHQTRQPSLDEVAEHIHLSSFHFQRLFQEWAGTSPKKFLQYISLSHAKKILQDNHSLAETTYSLGLSSSSRLHDLFVKVEAMTPAEYKNAGALLHIHYSIQDSPFGKVLLASTQKGICHIGFISDEEDGLQQMTHQFSQAQYTKKTEQIHLDVLGIFDRSTNPQHPIHVHLKGSPFQLKVWESLLKIPFGDLKTYKDIAQSIHQPTASRAVGTAIGKNPLAYLIPCHRVIQASGVIGGYRWDPIRKTALIGWESVPFPTL